MSGGRELEKKEKSALDRALEALLVGEARVRIDPTTGQAIPTHGEKASLTDSPEPHRID